MNVIVNGTPRELQEEATVADLLTQLGFRPEQVAVEVNRELVPRSRHGSHRLQPGDAVEVVTLVGGGAYGEHRER